MITSQLSRTIARHLAIQDPSNLQSDALFDVVNAINSGLHLFFTEAPAFYKRTTFSSVFRAPITMSVTFTEQYSNTVTGTPFDESWYGCGIKATGMAKYNEIAGVSSVLDSWLTPTLTSEIQVLFDCQILPVTIERITSDVRSYDQDGTTVRILQRDQQGYIERRRYFRLDHATYPQHYRLEPTALVAGGNTASFLRIHPAPIVDTIVRFEAEISAASITAANIIQPTLLPIADAWVPLLIPLCEEALTDTFPRSRRKAVAETGLPALAFPDDCPYTVPEVLAVDFFPK